MTIHINFQNGSVLSIEDLPANSVAVDGIVQGPALDTAKNRWSFDHHGDCLRLVTKAAAEQVLDARRLGLSKIESIYVNHIDIDSVFAGVLVGLDLDRVLSTEVADAVREIGAADAHGPGYLGETRYMGTVQALFSDFNDRSREVQRQFSQEEAEEWYIKLYNSVSSWLESGCTQIPSPERPEREFEITHTGQTGWVMAKSDAFVFDLVYSQGHNKAIVYTQLPDGSYRYTVGVQSGLAGGFPVGPGTVEGTILHALNQVESGWGGGSTIGGSPRREDGRASSLRPDTVFSIVEELLNK